ncbi:SKP1-like protein 21 [Olea europaea var. sylvestris]|uniref:SKP1-like protein 21 n=1 Tax=Olea europaea var. sylvestris TaxID=158386 RepID=UPI000C1D1E93|nr:SKP1-like protein 21 [Olea europaea var. sylvestris]
MTEADREIIKPEMLRAHVWLQTSDGSILQVEQEVAIFCPFICHEIQSGTGSLKCYPISLPSRVNPLMLSLILDYCRFHQVPGHSNKERKSFDERFARMDTKRLCELTSAADSLELKPLVDLTSRALARVIEGKTPEEIREIFHLPDDLTEEEKLEPIKNTMDDPRIRLLNRLYARKRKELKERERLKVIHYYLMYFVINLQCFLRFLCDECKLVPPPSHTASDVGNQKSKQYLRDRGVTVILSYSRDVGICNYTCEVEISDLFFYGIDFLVGGISNVRLFGNSYDSKNILVLNLVDRINFLGFNCYYGFYGTGHLLKLLHLASALLVCGDLNTHGFVFADSKGTTTSKNKKKNRRRKDHQKTAPLNCSSCSNGTFLSNSVDVSKKESNKMDSVCNNRMVRGNILPNLGNTTELLDTGNARFTPEEEFDDCDLDDDIDPALKEEIDREVADFARRLNSDWPERLQEILSLGSERSQLPLSRNGNGT